MRPVNLLPQRYRPAQASGGARGSAYIVLGGLGALLMCVVAVVLTQRQVESGRAELARLQAETRAAEARAAALGDFGSLARLKSERLASVRRLASARVDWERVVRELAHVLPDGVWLRDLRATAQGASEAPAAGPAPAAGAAAGPTLVLEGCAPDHRAVATTLVRLRRLHGAREVDLTSSARAGGGGASATGGGGSCGGRRSAWGATVRLAAEPTAAAGASAERRSVPDRLGGGS